MKFTHELIGGGIAFKFGDKPDERIRTALKANGFQWHRQSGFWFRRRAGEWADLYCGIEKMLSPNRPDGECWKCGLPGKFRGYGAATPVFCDACEKANREAEAQRMRIAADDFDLANNRSM